MLQPGAENQSSVEQGLKRLETKAEGLQQAQLWHPATHDRRVELVFIGDSDMQKDAIQAGVEEAMLTKDELRVFLDEWGAGEVGAGGGPNEKLVNPFSAVPRCAIKI
jgi:hypothetical protein